MGRRAAAMPATCPHCRADGLYGLFLDPDDLACAGDAVGARWTVICQTCGSEINPR